MADSHYERARGGQEVPDLGGTRRLGSGVGLIGGACAERNNAYGVMPISRDRIIDRWMASHNFIRGANVDCPCPVHLQSRDGRPARGRSTNDLEAIGRPDEVLGPGSLTWIE